MNNLLRAEKVWKIRNDNWKKYNVNAIGILINYNYNGGFLSPADDRMTGRHEKYKEDTMKNTIKLFALLLALVICLSACGGSSAPAASAAPAAPAAPGAAAPAAPAVDPNRTLNLSILAALTTTDPHNTGNLQDQMFLKQIGEGLFHFNEDTAVLEPRVAESWTVSEDGKTYTFKIRSTAKFHNGDPVKASDCVFSYERAMANPRVNSNLTSIESVEAVDDSTFAVNLKAPNSAWMVTCSNFAHILSEKEVTAQGEAFGTGAHSAGCGPYVLTRVDGLDSYWEIEAFKDYHRGEASIKKVTYKPITEASAGLIAFESGELDWYIAPIANWNDLTANPKYNTELVAANHQSYFIINYTNDELQDENLRKAIAYAIDKETCNIVCYDGLAEIASYMYHPQFNLAAPAHDTTYEYNPELAKEYLAKSCMPNGGKLSGAIQCSAGGYFEKMAVVIQQNLADIGLEVEVTPMQSATNMDIMRKNEHFMGVSGGNGKGDYDGIRSWYHSSAAGTSFIKFAAGDRFDSKWMDEMLEKGAAETDVEKRREIYAELDSYVMDGAVFIPIFHKVQPFVWTKDLVVPVNYTNFPIVYEWSWAA